VHGQRGVQAVGEQFRDAGPLRARHRLVGERDRPRRPAGVGPAAGQRRGEPGPRRVLRGSGQHVVEPGRQAAGLRAEQLDRGRAEHSLGPPVQVTGVLAASRRLVVQARRGLALTGDAGRAGPVEELTNARRQAHPIIVG
jgi:hypothetical protein